MESVDLGNDLRDEKEPEGVSKGGFVNVGVEESSLSNFGNSFCIDVPIDFPRCSSEAD